MSGRGRRNNRTTDDRKGVSTNPLASVHGTMRKYEPEEALGLSGNTVVTEVVYPVLKVQCWCQAQVVEVPRTEVLAGRTGSCGQEGCGG